MLPVLSPLRLTVQILFLLVLCGGFSRGRTQPVVDSTNRDTTDLAPQLEPILDSFDATDRATEQAAERLAHLQTNPLDLNRAGAADLSILPGLSASAAHRIVSYRSEHGPFSTLASLQNVDGIPRETVHAVRPFLTIGAAPESTVFPAFETITSNLDFSLIQRYTRRLDLGRGYHEDRFLGPPGRLTSRLRLEHERRVQLALILDKDPGEPLRWSPPTNTYGFDHVAGSLALQNLGPIETLVLGNFSAQFGQGVALWQGIRFGKGRDPVSPVLQSGRGVLPYQSASESNFFRGTAATLDLPGGLSATGFVSRRHRDASPDSALARAPASDAPIPVHTLSSGGRHRTLREIARKGTFGETTLGGAFEYRSASLHLGTTGYYARFTHPLRPDDAPYRQFRVSGRRTSTVSAYGTAHLAPYTLFGEVARTPGGTYGGLLGGTVEVGEAAQAIVLGRRYPPRLASFYGNAFGDGGRPQNETGVYTGVHLRVARNWALGAYFDQFRASWLRFNVPRPSTGWEARAVLEYEPRPWLSTYLQVRAQGQEDGTEHLGPGDRRLEGVQEEHRRSARWHMEYVFSDALTLRTRIELSQQTTPETTAKGFFLSQGLRWSPSSSMHLDARMAFFDTDGYAARIYAYEHDLLYSFSVPVFFDRGRRSYLMARYDLLPTLTLEAKYGVTSYANRSTIGSGLNQIDGSRRRTVRFQVRWTL